MALLVVVILCHVLPLLVDVAPLLVANILAVTGLLLCSYYQLPHTGVIHSPGRHGVNLHNLSCSGLDSSEVCSHGGYLFLVLG